MSRINYINDWEEWKKICAELQTDPYEHVDCGIDLGGGYTFDFEYIGDIPEKEEE